MATHKSAEKRARQTVGRTARNTAVKSSVKTAIKIFRTALTGDDKVTTQAALLAATRALRKAASRGVFPKTTASRRVSRLVLAFNK